MGYMDISIGGSDTASDLNWVVQKNKKSRAKALALLRDELHQDNGCYNTHGCVNVALVLTEGAGPEIFDGCTLPEYRELIGDTARAVQELLDLSLSVDAADWPSKDEHVEAYRHLLGELEKL